jgi:type II secretory pathway pseudopilin PulG
MSAFTSSAFESSQPAPRTSQLKIGFSLLDLLIVLFVLTLLLLAAVYQFPVYKHDTTTPSQEQTQTAPPPAPPQQ